MAEIVAIIPSAGWGTRMGGDIRKQYLQLNQKPILVNTLEMFQNNLLIREIVPVIAPDDIEYCREQIIKPYNLTKIKQTAVGGLTRQKSVFNALQQLPQDTHYVVIHDGVRPLVTDEIISDTIAAAKIHGAAISAVPVKDTVKIADDCAMVSQTPNRKSLWLVHTPQVFDYQLILDAYHQADRDNYQATDDASLVERLGIKVKIVEGSYRNIKITTAEDLFFARILMEEGC